LIGVCRQIWGGEVWTWYEYLLFGMHFTSLDMSIY
jgi:hypothetical protein